MRTFVDAECTVAFHDALHNRAHTHLLSAHLHIHLELSAGSQIKKMEFRTKIMPSTNQSMHRVP